MPISEIELNEALNRAAQLMTPEGQRRIEYANKLNESNFDSNGSYVQPSESHNKRKTSFNEKANYRVNNNSSLPKAIQESIMKNPLDGDSITISNNNSILDTINYQQKNQESIVKETYSAPTQYFAPPQQQYIPQPMTIDYNYIRMIVNECVQANLKQIKEEILNESSLKAIRIGGENKIQLIDTKNNLYESKLEYKKNLSKKQ